MVTVHALGHILWVKGAVVGLLIAEELLLIPNLSLECINGLQCYELASR